MSEGDTALVAFAEDLLHALAPPGVRFQRDEPNEQRVVWRYAVWDCAFDEAPAISIEPPRSVVRLRTREVVGMLPAEQHDFVREAMARQIRRAEMFGRAPVGRCPIDNHAQLAGRTLAWTTAELMEAFPEESWFIGAERAITIPATVDEFLRKLPQAQRRPGWFNRFRRRPHPAMLVGFLLVQLPQLVQFAGHYWVAANRRPSRRRPRRPEWIPRFPRQSSDLYDADSRLAAIVSRLGGG